MKSLFKKISILIIGCSMIMISSTAFSALPIELKTRDNQNYDILFIQGNVFKNNSWHHNGGWVQSIYVERETMITFEKPQSQATMVHVKLVVAPNNILGNNWLRECHTDRLIGPTYIDSTQNQYYYMDNVKCVSFHTDVTIIGGGATFLDNEGELQEFFEYPLLFR